MNVRVTVEFTIEPFTPATPGPHVTASIDAARTVPGATVDVGPFGTTADVDRDRAAELSQAVVAAALANGATRVSMQLTATESKGIDT